jgi:hypothetical protein
LADGKLPEDSREPSLLELILSKGVTADHKDFNRLLLEALDESLDEILGRRVRLAFYDQLERDYYFGRQDIPKRLGDFLLIAERNFKKDGKVIQRAVAKRLAKKLE